jgi:hypothetical protein
MEKRKIDPRRRGLGGQSDFVAEQFVPNDNYKAQQATRVQKLTAVGLNAEDVARMFFIPFDLISDEKPKEEEAEDGTPTNP